MKKRKSIQLFASDGKHNLQYEGKCKLQIDRVFSMLIVEPEHEEYQIKCASFKCDFVMNKNVLFVFGEQELGDFVLIFDEEERCKKVYDLIVGDKAQSDVKEEMLINQFLLPLCNRFTENDDATIKLKTIVSQLIVNKEDEKEKNTTTMNNASDILGSSNSVASASNYAFVDANANDNDRSYIHGRRRHSQFDSIHISRDNGDLPKQPRIYSQTVDQELYKFIRIHLGMYIRRRLSIFTNTAKSECCQYSWSQEQKLYYCIGCKAHGKDVTAILDKDENGLKCIKMEDEKHICIPIPCPPENNAEMKILKKPDYGIVGNSDNGMVLIVFAEYDKSQCWEFQLDSTKSLFFCCKCSFPAKLMNYTTKNEYIELRTASHRCEFIPYEPTKYYHFDDLYLLSTDFEVQTYTKNDKAMTRLIVFDNTDRSLCHVYSSQKYQFLCFACRAKGFQVTAKLLQNSYGEEYVILSKKKHVCKLRMYPGLPKKEIILRPPDFELMEN